MSTRSTVRIGPHDVDLNALYAGATAARAMSCVDLIEALSKDAKATLTSLGIPTLGADTYAAVESHAKSTLAAHAAGVHITL